MFEEKNSLENQNKKLSVTLEELHRKNVSLQESLKKAEEDRLSSENLLEQARKEKALVDIELQTAKREAGTFRTQVEQLQKELDSSVAHFNESIAQEKNKLVGAESERKGLEKQVEQMKQKINELENIQKTIEEQMSDEIATCVMETRQDTLWGVQVLYGPLSLGQLDILEFPPVPTGLDVYEPTDIELLSKVREEFGVIKGVHSVPSTPVVEGSSSREDICGGSVHDVMETVVSYAAEDVLPTGGISTVCTSEPLIVVFEQISLSVSVSSSDVINMDLPVAEGSAEKGPVA